MCNWRACECQQPQLKCVAQERSETLLLSKLILTGGEHLIPFWNSQASTTGGAGLVFPRDGTSPRNWVGCFTSRVSMGRTTTTRATPLAANLPA